MLLEEFEDIKIVPLSAKNRKRVNDRSHSDARNGEKASHSYCIEQTGRAVGFAADAGADGEARGAAPATYERRGKEVAENRQRNIRRSIRRFKVHDFPPLRQKKGARMGHGAFIAIFLCSVYPVRQI